MDNFADRVNAAIGLKKSQLCVGLDPRLDKMPPHLLQKYRDQPPGGCGCGRNEASACLEEFCAAVIGATAPHAVAVKFQLACFEMYGPHGFRSFKKLCDLATEAGLIVIADAKRGDIGVSAESYAKAYLGSPEGLNGPLKPFNIDALTVNPLFGTDGVAPFIEQCRDGGKGIFVLVKTSNPSASEFQDLRLEDGGLVHEKVAGMVAAWGKDMIGKTGYSSIGAVVGATHPGALAAMRKLLPSSIFLVPGVGAQGAGPAEAAQALDGEGLGALITASRSIIYAGNDERFAARATEAAAGLKEELWDASH